MQRTDVEASFKGLPVDLSKILSSPTISPVCAWNPALVDWVLWFSPFFSREILSGKRKPCGRYRPGFINRARLTFWGWIILRGWAALGIAGCWTASLVSTHLMPGAPPLSAMTTQSISRHCQVSPDECSGGKIPPSPSWEPFPSPTSNVASFRFCLGKETWAQAELLQSIFFEERHQLGEMLCMVDSECLGCCTSPITH